MLRIWLSVLSWYGMLPHFSRDSVSLGAWFGFAFLAAVLCELCGKEELNREERQGFAKDGGVLICLLGLWFLLFPSNIKASPMVGMQRTPIFAKHDQATKWLLPADLQGVLIIH